MNADVALTRIGQIAILVQDTDRAVRFYRDTLGLTFLFQPSPTLAFFDCGGVRLMLDRPTEDLKGAGTSILYYHVADIKKAYETLRAKGVTFEDTPHIIAQMRDHILWMTFFRDSERNLVGLMSEVPDAQE